MGEVAKMSDETFNLALNAAACGNVLEALELTATALATARAAADEDAISRYEALLADLERTVAWGAEKEPDPVCDVSDEPFPVDLLLGFFEEDDVPYSRLAPGCYKVDVRLDMSVHPDLASFGVLFNVGGSACELKSFPLIPFPKRPRDELVDICNDWNSSFRVPRASVDRDGDLRLDMVVLGGYAVSQVQMTWTCRYMLDGTVHMLQWLAAEHPDLFGQGMEAA
jgi:hypothetical protein